ncbi:MAG: serine/threonine-protein kinase, partial [Gluconacetobacter diazotrophicus]|nr:serine/threonine-protein kinase [Gluconacetobacter diazotrophicus]
RVLFCSNNPFAVLPPVLGECPALCQVGFRDCRIREVPAEALPPDLRWLTLTGNRIAVLPDAIGRRPRLRKLMLAGNRIAALPESLAGAAELELLRLAGNRLDELPPWLADLPALAWLAWSGNPFEPVRPVRPVREGARSVPATELAIGAVLGRGASGTVHRAAWTQGGGSNPVPVAVKRFGGDRVGSDGAPEHERAAALAAGDHPCLVGTLGQVEGGAFDGALLMPLVPDGWEVLAAPPSFESCSRDVYAADRRFTPGVAARIAADAAAAMAHLHGAGLLHGDLYGHNLFVDPRTGAARLGDLGAASFLPAGADAARWRALDVRAWGILAGELIERCDAPPPALCSLRDACLQTDGRIRPDAVMVAAEARRSAER